MAEETKKTLDDLLKEAQISRVNAEIARLEAGKRKLELEAKRLERIMGMPWYKRRLLLQATIAGLVAVPLIWFYVTEIAVPLFQKENIQLARQNEVTRDSLMIAKKDYEQRLSAFEEAKRQQEADYLSKLRELQNANAKLDSGLEKMSQDYNNLSNQNRLTRRERDEFSQKYQSTQKESERLKTTIRNLNAKIVEAERRYEESKERPFLFENAVVDMVKKKAFYHKRSNPSGKGARHQYNLVRRPDGNLIFDGVSGRTWQQSGSLQEMDYANAERYVKNLNGQRFGGYRDWRLPTLEEAMSLMEPRKAGDLHIDSKFDRKQRWIWTADKQSGQIAWVVDFSYGDCSAVSAGYKFFLRAVR